MKNTAGFLLLTLTMTLISCASGPRDGHVDETEKIRIRKSQQTVDKADMNMSRRLGSR